MQLVYHIPGICASEADNAFGGRLQLIQVLFIGDVREHSEEGVVSCARNGQLINPTAIVYLQLDCKGDGLLCHEFDDHVELFFVHAHLRALGIEQN